jgi:hypothetical protein
MFGAAAFTYGILMSFVLSGASRNIKLRRPHPPMMMYVGYVLCGISAGLAVFAAFAAMRAGGIV